MHIVLFIAGTVVLTAACLVAGWVAGLSGWLLAGLCFAVLTLAQVVYLIFVGLMAREQHREMTGLHNRDALQPTDDHAPAREG